MRKLILAAALMTAVACQSDNSVQPDETTINIRVVDDRGDPVYRTVVTVTFDGQPAVSALTGHSGTATIRVSETGDYVVRVIPRSGYVGEAVPITKTVSVTANSTTTVNFTISRAGLPI